MSLELSHQHLQNFRAHGEVGYRPIIHQDEMMDSFKQWFSYCSFEIQGHKTFFFFFLKSSYFFLKELHKVVTLESHSRSQLPTPNTRICFK